MKCLPKRPWVSWGAGAASLYLGVLLVAAIAVREGASGKHHCAILLRNILHLLASCVIVKYFIFLLGLGLRLPRAFR